MADAKPQPETMSVSALKNELRTLGFTNFDACIEKSDLIARLNEHRAKAPVPSTDADAAAQFSLELTKATVIGNTQSPKSVILLSHGLGDSADGWTDVAQHWSSLHPEALFVLPTAPQSPVTMNMGMRMNSWYDIKGLSPNSEQDATGMQASGTALNGLARAACEKYNVPFKNTIFAGFSQGAVISLWAGILAKEKVGGVIMMSGYVGGREVMPNVVKDFHRELPVIMCHGDRDPVIPYQMGQMSHKGLTEMLKFKDVTFKTYFGLVHSANPQEISDVSKWISERQFWKE